MSISLTTLKNCFLKGKISMNKNEIFMWSDIQRHIPETLQTDWLVLKEFLSGLKALIYQNIGRRR